MNKLMMVASAAMVGAMVTGCATTKEKVTEEYNRITSLPPAERIVCGCDKSIDDLGGAVCDARNFAQGKLVAYVKATENHREYVGFMNDVEVLIKEERLSNEDAVKKLNAEILAADATRADADKVWPRIVEGIIAVEALKPEAMLAELAVATLKNADLTVSASGLQASFSGFDATTLRKESAVANIAKQAAETAECLALLTEQFRKVQVAKLYMK